MRQPEHYSGTPRTDAVGSKWAKIGEAHPSGPLLDEHIEIYALARQLEGELARLEMQNFDHKTAIAALQSAGVAPSEADFLRRVRDVLCPTNGMSQPMTEEQRAGLDMIGDRLIDFGRAPQSAIGARDWEAKYKNDLHNFMALERWLNSHYPSVMEEWEDTPTDSRSAKP